MTESELRAKYPEMPTREIARLVEIEKMSTVTDAQLCRIDDPDCEACQ